MKNVRVRIVGTTPLLLHRFTDQDQMTATNGSRTSSLTGDRGSPEEQAERSLYKDESGTLVIPQPNLFRCIIDAGKFFKNGKSKVTTQKSSLIPACVEVHGVTLPLQSENGWSVDARPVRIPATGGRIIRYRPIFYEWSIDFEMTVDESEMSVPFVREIIDTAGRKIGLGDFRPDTKGPFGKFRVDSWKETS